jgi:mono/diheme cytochrome c family protein
MPHSTKHHAIVFIATISAIMMSGLSAFAADAARGKIYAQRVCSLCHAVSGNQASPNAAAPPFRVVAQSKSFREKGDSLLWEKHPSMPNLAFTEDEGRDAAAYIRTLKKRK